jgi:hypothetical protein
MNEEWGCAVANILRLPGKLGMMKQEPQVQSETSV